MGGVSLAIGAKVGPCDPACGTGCPSASGPALRFTVDPVGPPDTPRLARPTLHAWTSVAVRAKAHAAVKSSPMRYSDE